jgi:hypothetical protein
MNYYRKTKDELIREIKETQDYANDLKKKLEALERYKQYEEAANELMALKESFIAVGFTDEQAYEMMLTLAKEAMNQKFGR